MCKDTSLIVARHERQLWTISWKHEWTTYYHFHETLVQGRGLEVEILAYHNEVPRSDLPLQFWRPPPAKADREAAMTDQAPASAKSIPSCMQAFQKGTNKWFCLFYLCCSQKKKFFFGAAYMFRNHMSGKKLLCHNHEVFMKGTHITAASSSQCVESSTRSKRCRWVPHTLCRDWQQPGQILKWISAALHKEYTVMSPLNDPNNVPYREIDSPSFALLYQHNISHEYSALKHH